MDRLKFMTLVNFDSCTLGHRIIAKVGQNSTGIYPLHLHPLGLEHDDQSLSLYSKLRVAAHDLCLEDQILTNDQLPYCTAPVT